MWWQLAVVAQCLIVFGTFSIEAASILPQHPFRIVNPVVPEEPLLQIHLVPHSHDDVGWIRTIDEYYHERVKHIYNNVLSALLERQDRKFIIVEQAFFQRWFHHDASPTQQRDFRRLLEKGQFEFILGGWVMHDEACTLSTDIVNQVSLGHRFLHHDFGIIPRYGYQIDPFGHASFTPAMYARMGMNALLINRIHYKTKEERIRNGTMAFLWERKNVHDKERDQMLTHVLDEHYSSPPGLDFEKDPPIGDQNDLERRAIEWVEQVKRRAKGYPSQQHFLQLIGDDFRFLDAKRQFENWERIIDHVNQHSKELGVQATYSTLHDYFTALHQENPSFQTFSGDFFPYADREDAYWTGYFTSKSLLKHQVRLNANRLRHLEVLASRLVLKGLKEEDQKGLSQSLERFRQAEAEVQHHDGITGTAKEYVTQMYEEDLRKAHHQLEAKVGPWVHKLMQASEKDSDGDIYYFHADPLEKLERGQRATVLVQSSLLLDVEAFIEVPLIFHFVRVVDQYGQILPFEVIDGNGKYQLLVVRLHLKPLALSRFFVERLSEQDPHPSALATLQFNQDSVITINNSQYRLELHQEENKPKHATLIHIESGLQVPLDPHLLVYKSYNGPGQASGAYIMRTYPYAEPLRVKTGVMYIKGELVQEIHVHYHDQHQQIFRLKVGGQPNEPTQNLEHCLEIQTHVNTLQPDQELVLRFGPLLEGHNPILASDSNGMWMEDRPLDPRPNEIGANYYPMPLMSSLRNGSHQISFLTDRSIAVGHQLKGRPEFLLHRRTSHDDGRGVDEPLDDTSSLTHRLHICMHNNQSDAEEQLKQLSLMKRFVPLNMYKRESSFSERLFDAPALWKKQQNTNTDLWHLESIQILNIKDRPLFEQEEEILFLMRFRFIGSQLIDHVNEEALVRNVLKQLGVQSGAELKIDRQALSGVLSEQEVQKGRFKWNRRDQFFSATNEEIAPHDILTYRVTVKK